MLYWFPKIKDIEGIQYPKTEFVKVSWGYDYYKYISEEPIPQDVIERLKITARRIGYPLFMRTDHLSGKHSLAGFISYIENEDMLVKNLYRLLEESACAGLMGLPVEAIVLREYVELDACFKAFGGIPIAKERRYFIKDGKVLCHHPYWEEAAIRFWKSCGIKEPDNWRKKLAKINKESKKEVKLLTKKAQLVANVMEGFWSIDFAHTKDGRWILIDMAVGEDSWHPPECEYCPEEIRVVMSRVRRG